MAIPNNIDFSPFDPLTASQMDDLIENDVALANGTAIDNDAITDAKLVYGKLRSRRGGSATDWTSQGTNNYDYSATNTFMQAGASIMNTAHASVAITFPTAFAQKPLVFCTTISANSSNDVYATARDITTTGFNLYNNSGNNGSAEIASWMAIGQ